MQAAAAHRRLGPADLLRIDTGDDVPVAAQHVVGTRHAAGQFGVALLKGLHRLEQGLQGIAGVGAELARHWA